MVKAIPLGKWVKSIGKIRAQSKTSLEWEKPLRTTQPQCLKVHIDDDDWLAGGGDQPKKSAMLWRTKKREESYNFLLVLITITLWKRLWSALKERKRDNLFLIIIIVKKIMISVKERKRDQIDSSVADCPIDLNQRWSTASLLMQLHCLRQLCRHRHHRHRKRQHPHNCRSWQLRHHQHTIIVKVLSSSP